MVKKETETKDKTKEIQELFNQRIREKEDIIASKLNKLQSKIQKGK